MSLLHDALRRASQSHRNRPPPAPTRAALPPVAERRGQLLPLSLGIGLVLALASAGWLFGRWWSLSHAPPPAKVEPLAAAAPKPAPAPVEPAAVAPPVAPAPPPVAVPTPAPPLAPPAKPVEVAWPAELKVMGIFFGKTHPWALINGKTVGLGDEIDGIRVTRIESDRVSVAWNGQVKELRMH